MDGVTIAVLVVCLYALAILNGVFGFVYRTMQKDLLEGGKLLNIETVDFKNMVRKFSRIKIAYFVASGVLFVGTTLLVRSLT